MNLNVAFIEVKVTPRAAHDSIEGWREGRLSVRIRGVPEQGKVNARLLRFLAKQLSIAPSRLSIVSGEKHRLKRIRVEGMTRDQVQIGIQAGEYT